MTLPTTARVHLEDGKRKTDQFILGPRQKFYAVNFLTPEELVEGVERYGWVITQFLTSKKEPV